MGLRPLAFVILMTIAAVLPARADLFVVPGVIVSMAAGSSVEAKAQAEASAKEKAFRRLAERLVVQDDLAVIDNLPVARIDSTIASVQVLDEVITGTTFDGRFNFRFDPPATRKLLAELGLRYTEVQSRPYVVVPVYGNGGEAVLWDDPNPWRAAWENFGGTGDGLVPVEVPLGDLQDVSAVDAAGAISGDRRGLGDLAGNYNALGAVVAKALVTGNPTSGGASMALTVSSYGEVLGQPLSVTLTQAPDEQDTAFFERGVIAVLQGLEASWKEANAVPYPPASVIEVRALASALQDWLLIRKELEGEALVSGLRILTMQRGAVKIAVTHRGTAGQLQNALDQRGLSLLPSPEGWDLQLGAALGGVHGQALPAPVSPALQKRSGGQSTE